MTKQEAIVVFEEIRMEYDNDPNWGLYDGAFSRSDIKKILDAYVALRGGIASLNAE